jgi:hypothetical protein
MEALLAPEPERAEASHGSTPASGTTRRHAARAEKAEDTKGRGARTDTTSRRVPAAPRAVAQGWGMNWPTSNQNNWNQNNWNQNNWHQNNWHQDNWPTSHQDAFHPAYAERRSKRQNGNMSGSFAFFGGASR